jgi:hypothetical protein
MYTMDFIALLPFKTTLSRSMGGLLVAACFTAVTNLHATFIRIVALDA